MDTVKSIGNKRSNALFNPDPIRHPPPTDFEGDDRQSELERFIFKKYRDKAFVHREPLEKSRKAPRAEVKENVHFQEDAYEPERRTSNPFPPRAHKPAAILQSSDYSRSAPNITRSLTAPLPEASRTASPAPTVPNLQVPQRQMTASAQIPSRTGAQSIASGYPAAYPTNPFSNRPAPQAQPSSAPSFAARPPPPLASPAQPKGGVWDDLAGLSIHPTANNSTLASTHSLAYPSQYGQHSPSISHQPTGYNPFLQSNGLNSLQPQPQATTTPYAMPSVSGGFKPSSAFGQQLMHQMSPQAGAYAPQQLPLQQVPAQSSSNPFLVQAPILATAQTGSYQPVASNLYQPTPSATPQAYTGTNPFFQQQTPTNQYQYQPNFGGMKWY